MIILCYVANYMGVKVSDGIVSANPLSWGTGPASRRGCHGHLQAEPHFGAESACSRKPEAIWGGVRR